MAWRIRSPICWLAIGLAPLPIGVSTPAPLAAQARSPLYEAARRQGLVGEKVDGYLGFVVPPSPELRRLVQDINIKRKALYFEQAQAKGIPPDDYAFIAGCIAIERTAPGEKYQAPDGSWRTRGTEPPVRDSRCP